MDVGKFITKLMMNLSPPWEESIDASHRGVPLPSGDPLRSSEIVKDPLFVVGGLANPRNNEDQSLKVGSWSNGDDRPSKVSTIDPKAGKA